jgi:hypothetical protein
MRSTHRPWRGMDEVVQPLLQGIAQQRRVRFVYHGHMRTVEPHIIGEDNRGHAALSGYQVGGGSDSGASTGWKLFHVEQILGSVSVGETFQRTHADYNPDDKSFAWVWARL